MCLLGKTYTVMLVIIPGDTDTALTYFFKVWDIAMPHYMIDALENISVVMLWY